MKYLDKKVVAEVLSETARRVAMDCNAQHPVDIAIAMSFAIEYGAETLAVLMEKELL